MTVGAFNVIFDTAGAVLLCRRRDRDLWNLPGGRVEQGESPWAAAVREAKEEVGLDVEIIRLLGVYYKPKEDDLVFMFLSKVPMDARPTLSSEVREVGYFTPGQLPENISPRQKARLVDYFAAGGLSFFKTIFQVQ